MKTILASQIVADACAWTVLGIWCIGAVLVIALLVLAVFEAGFQIKRRLYGTAQIFRWIEEGHERDRKAGDTHAR